MTTKLERVQPILDAVEKAGGVKLSLYKELNSKEKGSCTFNIWGALFGIFYYVYHGMWKKGLALLGIVIVLNIILSFTIFLLIPALANGAFIISMVVYAVRTPVNLYSHYKLNDDSWNPLEGFV